MDISQTHNMTLTDAITIAEGFEPLQNSFAVAEKFFDTGIKSIDPNDYEKRGQYYYYLLRILLRKHNNFENPLLLSYYERMTESFVKRDEVYREDLSKEDDVRKQALIKTQIKAFYKMLEKMYQSLYLQYQRKGFYEAKDRSYEQLMFFRTKRFWAEKKYEKVASSLFLKVTTNYGMSLYRWGVSSVGLILLFALLYLLVDKIIELPLIANTANWGLDYIYFSVSTFAGFGAGNLLDLHLLHKFLIGAELMAGYVMLGLFIHLIIKRL